MKQLTWGCLVFISILFMGCHSDTPLEKVKKKLGQLKIEQDNTLIKNPHPKKVLQPVYRAHNFRSPFEKPAVGSRFSGSTSKASLKAYSIDELKAIGTIVMGGKRWVILQARAGELYPVALGDFVGKGNWQVTVIDSKVIKLEKTEQGKIKEKVLKIQ